ncbi:TPA: hemolysin XhlA [Yersinia enterocolitica]|uniref:hemolysin XhlA n=1 Tax=Yersinia rohdei TaxID=29485 RepID=UPI0021BDE3F9|nr:hemolysin XhlA [Yersinia rohdei]
MKKVDYLRSVDSSGHFPHTPSHDGGNGGGDDMLERVKKLESQMLSLLTDVAVIKSNYVTKADLHEEISKQTKWIAATVIGTTGLALTVAKFIF